jgi:nucleoside-diphosphate-sugar epimerase
MEAIHRGRILPFGAIRNRRSLVGVVNLCDALFRAAMVPWPGITACVGDGIRFALVVTDTSRLRLYHIADEGVIGTRRLVEVLAEGMGVRPRLVSVPRWLAVGGATLFGKRATARRLFDDLEVDDSDFRRDFAWKPLIGLEDGLKVMAESFTKRNYCDSSLGDSRADRRL